jgi:hypothetical protein
VTREQSSEAKEYLKRIGTLDEQISRKIDRAEALKALAMKVTPTMSDSGAMGGGNQDKMAIAVDRLLDLEKEIDRDKQTLIHMQDEAYALLGRVRNRKYYKVLELHYLKYQTFEQIGVAMGYSKRWAEKLHGRALEVFSVVLKAQK